MAVLRKVKVVFAGLVFMIFLHLMTVNVFTNNIKTFNTTNEDMDSTIQFSARMKLPDLKKYENNHKEPLLLLFTTFKDSSLRSEINNNTIEYWSLLKPWVQPLLFVENTFSNNSAANHAKDKGWLVYRAPTLRKGIPMLRDMFLRAEQLVSRRTTFIAYANSDILFTMDLVETLSFLHIEDVVDKINQSILVIGRRKTFLSKELLSDTTSSNKKYSLHDLNLVSSRDFDNAKAVDYFITLRDQFPWENLPDFVVGKPGYDNWLPAKCLEWDISPIDASLSITALHQVLELSNPEGGWRSADVCMNRNLVDPFDYSKGRTVCTPHYTKRWPSTRVLQSTEALHTQSTSVLQTGSTSTFQLRTRSKKFHVLNKCAEPDQLTISERIKRFFTFIRRPMTCEDIANVKKSGKL